MRQVLNVRRELVYLPARAEDYFRGLAPDMALSPQRGADLGERLEHLLAAALEGGAQKAVVIGSDSPTLPAAYIVQVFTLLDTHQLVLGPCDDGGYYLIRLTEPQPRLVREVTLSVRARNATPGVRQLRASSAVRPSRSSSLLCEEFR